MEKLVPKCDKCNVTINEETDEAICFEGDNGQLFLCMKCVKVIEDEVFNNIVGINNG